MPYIPLLWVRGRRITRAGGYVHSHFAAWFLSRRLPGGADADAGPVRAGLQRDRIEKLSGGGGELLLEAEAIERGPAFDDAVAADAPEDHSFEHEAAVGGREGQHGHLAAVGAGPGGANRDEVAFGDDVLDPDPEIGEGLVHHGVPAQGGLRSGRGAGRHLVVDEIGR